MAVSRRAFLGVTGGMVGGAGIVGGFGGLAAPARARQPDPSSSATWSPITDAALAREVVGVSHSNFDRVKELVEAHPELAKSTIDGGFGDWEAAIGAASHTGRRDIAELLIAHGARPDIFTFAMLGNVDAVRAMIRATPGLQRLPGPHGLSLMHHARAGGDEAAGVLDYLSTLEGADDTPVSQPLADATAVDGRYQITGGGIGGFEIGQGRRATEFRIEGVMTRSLVHVGGLEFHPVGAPSVRLRFDTPRVRIELGGRVIEAERRPA